MFAIRIEPSLDSKPNDEEDSLRSLDVDPCSRIQTLLIKKVGRGGGAKNGHFQVIVTTRKSEDSVRPPTTVSISQTASTQLQAFATPPPPSKPVKKVELKEAVVRMKRQFICQVPTAPAPAARFVCVTCKAKLRTPQSLRDHMTSVHGEKPHLPCHLCGNTYDSKEALLRHVSTAHEGKNGKQAHMCWVCLEQGTVKGFTTWKMLERHLTATHKIHKSHIDHSKRLKTEDSEADSKNNKRNNDSSTGGDQPIKKFVSYCHIITLYSRYCIHLLLQVKDC